MTEQVTARNLVAVRVGDVEWSASPTEAADLLRHAADQLAEGVTVRNALPGPLDVEEAAATLGVSVEWVREHAVELGGWKVDPSRPRSHWRFDRAKLLESRESSCRQETATPPEGVSPKRRRPKGRSKPLLEVRGKPAV